ncbi:MAG: hypothetical protein ACFFG0_05275 [Candidatus Thorarchaeota archaeon]
MITDILCWIFPNPIIRDKIANFIYLNIKLFIIIKLKTQDRIGTKLLKYLLKFSIKTKIRIIPSFIFRWGTTTIGRLTLFFDDEVNPIIDYLNDLFNIPKYLR